MRENYPLDRCKPFYAKFDTIFLTVRTPIDRVCYHLSMSEPKQQRSTFKKAKVDAEKLATVALGHGRSEIMAQTGVGEDAARVIRRVANATIEEYREIQRTQLQGMLEKLGQRLETEIEELNPYQKVIAYGILTDKLHNQPQSLNNSLHIHLKGGDSASALRSILGPAADKLLNAKPAVPVVDV